MTTYRMVSFGEVELDQFQENEIMGSGISPTSYFRLPGGGAIDNYGVQKTYPGTVSRDKTMVLVEPTDLDLQTLLNKYGKLVGTRNKLYRQDGQGNDSYVYARLVNTGIVRTTEEQRSTLNRAQTIALFFQCETDYWIGDRRGTWLLNDGFLLNDNNLLNDALLFEAFETWELNDGNLLNNGLFINDQINPVSPNVFTITITDSDTEGKILAQSIEILITAQAGVGFTSVLVANDQGESVEYTGSVDAGDVLVINSGNNTVRNDGVGEWDNLTTVYGPNPHTIFSLAVGVNTITVTHDGIQSIEFRLNEWWIN